jgi:integrase
MPKYCSENEKVKRAYTFYLEAASGKQNATIDSALRAIARFEESTGSKPFSKFGVEQARSFRARLVEPGPDGKLLSAATVSTTLKHLRNFFLWLSREPGYRSRLNPNDAQYFNPSEQDRRIAGARREGHVPTLEDIKRVLNAMPSQSPVEKRDRALVAFAVLSGARDGAMVTFRLKHLDLAAGTIFQDGREVKTKRRPASARSMPCSILWSRRPSVSSPGFLNRPAAMATSWQKYWNASLPSWKAATANRSWNMSGMPFWRYPLFPIIGTGIGAAHAIGIDVSQLPLNGVGAPEPALVQHRGGGRPKAVPRHLILAKPKPAQRRVDRVLAHASLLRTD